MDEHHDDAPEALTVKQAADLLQLSQRTIREMFARGELAGNRVGRRRTIRLCRSSVVDWLRGMPVPRSRRHQ